MDRAGVEPTWALRPTAGPQMPVLKHGPDKDTPAALLVALPYASLSEAGLGLPVRGSKHARGQI